MPVLASALFGFALATILSTLLSVAYTISFYGRTNTILSSYGSGHVVPLIVQAAAGLLAGGFARGAITWLALNAGSRDHGGRAALRAILARWPLLLLTTLATGALIFAGNLGLNALLVELRFDLADISQFSLSFDGMVRSITLRVAGSLIPDPGSPFTELLTYLRLESSRVSANLVYAGGLSYYRVKNIPVIQSPWLLGVGGIGVLLAVDTFSRFLMAGVVRALPGTRLASVWAALRLALRHFALVLAHTWIVRLAIFTVSALFMTVPLVLVEGTLVPLLVRAMGSAWPIVIAGTAMAISMAVVSTVLLAFSVVYDACLYRRLTGCPESAG